MPRTWRSSTHAVKLQNGSCNEDWIHVTDAGLYGLTIACAPGLIIAMHSPRTSIERSKEFQWTLHDAKLVLWAWTSAARARIVCMYVCNVIDERETMVECMDLNRLGKVFEKSLMFDLRKQTCVCWWWDQTKMHARYCASDLNLQYHCSTP